MGKKANFSPFSIFYYLLFIHLANSIFPLLPHHTNSLCPALLYSFALFFPHAYTIFISFPSITLPFFPPTVFHSYHTLLSTPTLTHSSATSLTLSLSLSPLYFAPSQMSDHSLVFRLPCHHIFHTAPSLNWACIIISYHVE